MGMLNKYFTKYYFHLISSIPEMKDLISKKSQEIYFSEFKRYFRRQILKKICYGSLEQLLSLNIAYRFELDKLNCVISSPNKIVYNKKIVKHFNFFQLLRFEWK